MFTLLGSAYEYCVFKRPAITLSVVVLCAVVLTLGLPNFKLDASADSLTLESDQALDYFRETNQRYQSGEFLVVTYTPKASMFSDESLSTLAALRDELAEVEGVVSINSMLDVPLLYSPMRSLAEQQESTRTLETEGVDREQARNEFLNSPIYRDMLLSADGRTTALQLNLAVDNRYYAMVSERDELRNKQKREGLSNEEAQRLAIVSQEFLDYRTANAERGHERVATIREILQGYEDKAEVFLGGVSMITTDMIAFIKNDLVVFGAAIIAFIVLMLALIFRQMRFVALPLGICLLTVTMMLGWLSWIDWRLTVISSNFVALLLIMTLAITIYLVVRYRELHARHPHWDQRQLVLTTVRQMARPCFYTVLTTLVAFMSLVVSDIRPVIDFGWIMTIGLSLAFALSFIIFPATLMLLPKGEPKDKGDNTGAFTLHFSSVAERYGNIVVGVALVAAVVAIYGMSRLEVENRFIDYFHEDTEIHQGMLVIDQQLGGTISLDIILDSPQTPPPTIRVTNNSDTIEEDSFGFTGEDPFALEDDSAPVDELSIEDDPFGMDDPFAEPGEKTVQHSAWFNTVGLETITELHQYLESLPEVGKVQSLAIMYEVARDINKGRLNNFELDVMRNMFSDDIRGFLIDPYLSDEQGETRFTLRVQETYPDLRRTELVEKIRDFAVDGLGLMPEQVHFTGMLVLYNNMLQSLFQSQILTLGTVFLCIMLMFLVLFRSFTIAIISMMPSLLAASVVLGGMGWVGVPLDMMTITIAAITVGVGVDHAIHYLYRFRGELAECGNYVQAMHRAHASIGRAMYYTAMIIIVGFSILALSEFIPSIYFGLLTALAMFTAIVGSLTLLPKLVLITQPFGKPVSISQK